MEIGHYVTILVSLIVASLALQNFFKQKWWERRERIYSDTIEKLQEIQIALFYCKIDLINIDKFHFDNKDIRYENQISLHSELMDLLLLSNEFDLYEYKLSPYFFKPSLDKVKNISHGLSGYLSFLDNHLNGDEPIDFDDRELNSEIFLSLGKANGYLSMEIQKFAFYMKSDLRVNIKYAICGYILQMRFFWRRIRN